MEIAEALLLSEGEIALSDVEAIPAIEDDQAANRVIGYLVENFNVVMSQRRRHDLSGQPLEDVIMLILPDSPRRSAIVSR
jgi:hypothetical protein